MGACPEAMEAAPCSLTYDLKRFFKQQGKIFGDFLRSDEVRHNRPKFDICRKVFFWRPWNVKIEFFTSSFHRPEF
jgi:hypothetical protein